jgi:two-component system, OmpR family, response regulator
MRRLERVLYVEDEEAIREITSIALRTIGGLEVMDCDSGRAALQAAAHFVPDLMLLDVMMPGMDGIETLAALRALPTFAGVPAVFLTAKVLPDEVAGLRKLDVLEVLAKPFDPLQLAQVLESLWLADRVQAKGSG